MILRRCLRCRIQADTTQLIPLHLDAGGSLLVGSAPRGRGGWICPSCIDDAVEAPGVFNRCFRKRVSNAQDLPTSARSWIQNRVVERLKQTIRHGLLITKDDDLKFDPALTLMSNDHSPPKDGAIKSTYIDGSTYTIWLSSIELGHTIGQAPRFEVKLKPGRSTQSLLKTLRVWHRLG